MKSSTAVEEIVELPAAFRFEVFPSLPGILLLFEPMVVDFEIQRISTEITYWYVEEYIE